MLTWIYAIVPWSHIVAEFWLIPHIPQKLNFCFYDRRIITHQTPAVLQALCIPEGIAGINRPAMFLGYSLPRIWEKKFLTNG